MAERLKCGDGNDRGDRDAISVRDLDMDGLVIISRSCSEEGVCVLNHAKEVFRQP